MGLLTLVSSNISTVNSSISPAGQKTPSTAHIGEKFLELLEGQVPISKRTEIKEITTNKDLSVLQKAEAIRDKMAEYVESGVAGTTKFKTKANVEQWFETRLAQYNTQINEMQRIGAMETQTFAEPPNNMVTRIANYPGIDNLLRTFAVLYSKIEITRDNLLALCRRNVMVPMNFLIFRPHMQFATRAIIKCKQNGGSMYTFMGNEDFQIAHEAGRKMAMMHFTLYFRCVVHDARNVYVQPDVYIQEREGGCGTRFWTVDDYNRHYNPENLIASLFAIAIPYRERNFPNPMSATGVWETEYNQGIQNLRNQKHFLHYSTAQFYAGESMYKWNKDARTGLSVPHLMRGRTHRNLIMYQGHQQNYNIKRGDHSRITPNKGHLSKNIYAGCADIFNGALDVLEEQDYATKNSN